MKVILLGAPGAGKGTQASKICKDYDVVQISTGDIFRYNIKEKTPLGLEVISYLDKGQLVPDELTCSVVADRLQQDDVKNGYLLDGFPRNTFQAKFLDEMLEKQGTKLDVVLNIDADRSVLIDRAVGRRVCNDCKHTYHVVAYPPKVEGVCDHCGGKLIQRSDDVAETVADRIRVYEEQTAPLIEYYTQKRLLKRVDGLQDADKVYADITAVLNK